MKTVALALCALFLLAGAVPVALAQGTSPSPQPSPSASAPSSPSSPSSEPAAKSPGTSSPSGKVDVDIKARTDKSSDDAGAASPRSGEVHRTGFFGLSPTAAIIVSVAVLLVVILAIVAMSHSSGNTYIDTDRRI